MKLQNKTTEDIHAKVDKNIPPTKITAMKFFIPVYDLEFIALVSF